MSEKRKGLDIDALVSAMDQFKSMPRAPGAAICAVSQYLDLDNRIKQEAPALGFGMVVHSCRDLKNEECLFFDNNAEAIAFLNALEECHRYGIDPKPAIEDMIARFKAKVGRADGNS